MAKQNSGTGKRVSRINDVAPQVAARLAELAREMRELTYGGDGVPEWGTKFTEIESQGMNVGLELARLFMEQSVEEQAERVPESALEHHGEAAEPTKKTTTAKLDTAAGEVQWDQPQTRLATSGRAFFPSGEGIGDEHR
jgi:hypothetical protein